MNVEEFSNGFDTLVLSKMAQYGFGQENPLSFNEYEKSFFLTKSQLGLVQELYSGRSPIGSFESNEELRRALFSLVEGDEYTPSVPNGNALTINSYFITLKDTVMYITYEQVVFDDEALGCANGTIGRVVPVTHDALDATLRNPFKSSNERRVLRVDSNLDERIIELISKYNISKYVVRYIKKPTPIILSDLGDLSIEGVSTKTECSLSPMLHDVILDKAVDMALQSRASKG